MMVDSISEKFLEIASSQRLEIILKLAEKKQTISSMAKELNATVPEVHRNFTRLRKSVIIEKDLDGEYTVTEFGKLLCKIVPMIEFMTQNEKYFSKHNFGTLPHKFSSRIGVFKNTQLLNGYVTVMDKWMEIYKNAEKYIYNILVEVSYSKDIVNLLHAKLNKNIRIHSIFPTDAIVSKERKKLINEKTFQKFITNEDIKRKMSDNVPLIVVLNEKEACISFPLLDGTHDLSKMFYDNNADFHEWCYDYFDYYWKNSTAFQENKLQ